MNIPARKTHPRPHLVISRVLRLLGELLGTLPLGVILAFAGLADRVRWADGTLGLLLAQVIIVRQLLGTLLGSSCLSRLLSSLENETKTNPCNTGVSPSTSATATFASSAISSFWLPQFPTPWPSLPVFKTLQDQTPDTPTQNRWWL
jgi:hypothetical protein